MNSQHSAPGNSGLSLFHLAIDFNLFPVRYTHRSWLQQDKNYKLIESLKADPAAQFNLSAYLLRKFNLQNAYDYDFGRLDLCT